MALGAHLPVHACKDVLDSNTHQVLQGVREGKGRYKAFMPKSSVKGYAPPLTGNFLASRNATEASWPSAAAKCSRLQPLGLSATSAPPCEKASTTPAWLLLQTDGGKRSAVNQG